MRWTRIRHFHSEDNTAYYSVHEKLGMVLLLYLGRNGTILGYFAIDDWIITIGLCGQHFHRPIIQVYAPAIDDGEEVDELIIKCNIRCTKCASMICCLWLRPGMLKLRKYWEKCNWKHFGLGNQNEAGDTFTNFLHYNDFFIAYTVFKQPKRYCIFGHHQV